MLLGNQTAMDAGYVGAHLRAAGFRFEEAHREDPASWPDLGGAELLVTLGSEWHVEEPATRTEVAAEADYVRAALQRGVPLLAICFGAQVLSHALGGTVTRTPTPEIGWYALDLEPGAPAWAAGPWMEWHEDVFTVPEGFAVLARTAAGPQLVAGRRAVATQFHPEATETMVHGWLDDGGADSLRRRGGDPDALLAATREHVARSRGAAGELVGWFLERAG